MNTLNEFINEKVMKYTMHQAGDKEMITQSLLREIVEELIYDTAIATVEACRPNTEVGLFFGCNADDIKNAFMANFDYKAKAWLEGDAK